MRSLEPPYEYVAYKDECIIMRVRGFEPLNAVTCVQETVMPTVSTPSNERHISAVSASHVNMSTCISDDSSASALHAPAFLSESNGSRTSSRMTGTSPPPISLATASFTDRSTCALRPELHAPMPYVSSPDLMERSFERGSVSILYLPSVIMERYLSAVAITPGWTCE